MHYKLLFPKDYLGAHDLIAAGKDVTLTIAGVKMETLTLTGGRKEEKPVITFEGTEKKLVMNVTNASIIASIYKTPETDEWIGKRITLYPTTTQFGPDTVECIRIRSRVPAGKDAA